MAGEKNLKYKPEYDKLAENYCKLGAKDSDLAGFFDVTEKTINNWKCDFESFFHSIKSGKDFYDSISVEDSLLKRALGYEITEEKQEDGTNGSKTTTTKKHVAGDTTAMIFWLKNRNPSRWRDKQEIEQNTTITVKKGLGDFYADIANDD